MIKSLIRYLKKKQIIYQGFTATNFARNVELRIISKLLFSSGLSISEIKSMRWENLTILENILLLNYENKTKIAIASEYMVYDLIKMKHTSNYVFPNYKRIESDNIIKIINRQLMPSKTNKNINCNWLKENFINTVYVPKDSEILFRKYIVNKIPITDNLNKKEFKKILEIKSLI